MGTSIFNINSKISFVEKNVLQRQKKIFDHLIEARVNIDTSLANNVKHLGRLLKRCKKRIVNM